MIKGGRNQICNRTVCNNNNAIYYNTSIMRYYCKACAALINKSCIDFKEDIICFTALELWENFGDIPVNEEGEIEVSWHIFAKGTDKYDIWHWFEGEFDISIAEDFMGLK